MWRDLFDRLRWSQAHPTQKESKGMILVYLVVWLTRVYIRFNRPVTSRPAWLPTKQMKSAQICALIWKGSFVNYVDGLGKPSEMNSRLRWCKLADIYSQIDEYTVFYSDWVHVRSVRWLPNHGRKFSLYMASYPHCTRVRIQAYVPKMGKIL